jgi:hypothetical protein
MHQLSLLQLRISTPTARPKIASESNGSHMV